MSAAQGHQYRSRGRCLLLLHPKSYLVVQHVDRVEVGIHLHEEEGQRLCLELLQCHYAVVQLCTRSNAECRLHNTHTNNFVHVLVIYLYLLIYLLVTYFL